jgi:iron complex outermembrane recepter protein
MQTEGSYPKSIMSLSRFTAVGLCSIAASFSVSAQTAATPAQIAEAVSSPAVQLQQFTVSGSFAGSLEAAASAKQNSPALVEVIVPEDIGKLPDVSIADSLARLPGLTSQRINGRDQQITIRGFSPDFSIGTFDGIEQASTNDNRAVEYDQYPSELVGGVTVFKSGQADQVGGLAGTVNLETISPLSVGHQELNLSAYYNSTSFNQLTPGPVKANGESYSLSFITQTADRTEGVYVGYAHTENPYEGKQFQAWGYPTALDGNIILGGVKVYDQSELLKRDSVIAVIESKPTDTIHSKLDLFYSTYNDNELLNGFQIPMARYSAAVVLSPGYTVQQGLITNYQLTNVSPVIDNQVVDYKTHVSSAVWNLDLGTKSNFPIKVQAGISEASRKEQVLEEYAGLGYNKTETNPDTLVVSDPGGGQFPVITSSTNYSNPSLLFITDPQGWGSGNAQIGTNGTDAKTGEEGYLKYFSEKDIADSLKISTEQQINDGIIKDIVWGASISQRYKYDAQNPSGFLVNASGKTTAPLPTILGSSDLSWFGNINPVSWDANALLNSGALNLVPNAAYGSYMGDDYKVWETIIRPFAKLDFKGTLFGIPFTGNLGIQGNITNQKSNGFAGGGSSYVAPVSGESSYKDILPTLNFIFKLTKMDDVRLFVGRQEQRPRMYDMRAGSDYSYNAAYQASTTISPWGGSAGNPNLKPWIANSIDLDYEHYFPKGNGYVSIALFEKQLLTYIYQLNQVYNFNGYPYSTINAPVLYSGIVSQFVNGTGGKVSGAEATLQLDSAAVTDGAFRGLGLVLNGLIVDSTIQPWGPGNGTAPLPNMSKKSANVTLYYETHGFSVRVSEHYQSATREYIVQFGIPNPKSAESPGDGFSMETPFHTIDAQLSYSFKNGVLKGLTIYAEGRNLSNATLTTFTNGDSRKLMNLQEYGSAYRYGASYKF